MKKGKVIGKSQIIAVLMVVALGSAVWLNMRFSSDEKYLGEAKYVSTSGGKATETSAKVEESEDYFTSAKKAREKSKAEAEETVKELLDTDKLTEEDKAEALTTVKAIAKRIEDAVNIENLLKAKGFKKALAVIEEGNINIIVKSDGLTTTQTLQIQDIVTDNTGVNLANIKIVTVK